jgi:hypothetical protein
VNNTAFVASVILGLVFGRSSVTMPVDGALLLFSISIVIIVIVYYWEEGEEASVASKRTLIYESVYDSQV